MKNVTYTDPEGGEGRFLLKVRDTRHRFASGESVEVADDVAAALKSAAPDGAVKITDIPKDD